MQFTENLPTVTTNPRDSVEFITERELLRQNPNKFGILSDDLSNPNAAQRDRARRVRSLNAQIRNNGPIPDGYFDFPSRAVVKAVGGSNVKVWQLFGIFRPNPEGYTGPLQGESEGDDEGLGVAEPIEDAPEQTGPDLFAAADEAANEAANAGEDDDALPPVPSIPVSPQA